MKKQLLNERKKEKEKRITAGGEWNLSVALCLIARQRKEGRKRQFVFNF